MKKEASGEMVGEAANNGKVGEPDVLVGVFVAWNWLAVVVVWKESEEVSEKEKERASESERM